MTDFTCMPGSDIETPIEPQDPLESTQRSDGTENRGELTQPRRSTRHVQPPQRLIEEM